MPTRLAARCALPLFLLVAVAGTVACEPAHIESYTPKRRKFDRGPPTPVPEEASPGSLWGKGASESLFADQRAYRAGDVVVVQVEEVADAQRSADTGIDRNSSLGALVHFLPVLPFLSLLNLNSSDYAVDVEGSGSSETGFRSEGKTGRTERLVATVPAIVKEVLPNGNLIIEGQRAVLVNAEEHHLYVSGVIRPIDIDQSNTVRSSMIAEAEIEFVGRGVITDNQRQGWLSRHYGWVWPF